MCQMRIGVMSRHPFPQNATPRRVVRAIGLVAQLWSRPAGHRDPALSGEIHGVPKTRELGNGRGGSCQHPCNAAPGARCRRSAVNPAAGRS
eukprot:7187538-Prymnesium_polylepis.1